MTISFISCVQAAGADYRMYTSAGQPVSYQDVAQLINQYDVIVFGEYHDNAVVHALEADILAASFQRQSKLAVSLEMFERDVQSQVDDYLAGKIEEDEFLANSRPWKNYWSDYRPLVEFAKSHALPVVAGNIPRRLAAHYAKTGELTTIGVDDAVYLPEVRVAQESDYKIKFMEYMRGNTGMPVDAARLDNMYRAQCLKDDAMAEGIVEFIKCRPDYKVIHYQGDFHSRQRLGVVEKLSLLNPALKVAVITPTYVESFDDIADQVGQYADQGDVLIFLKKQEVGK